MLDSATRYCQLLSDPTRVRILVLLQDEELSVAELTEATGLAQSRVSTHLGRLREAGLVLGRKEGAFVFYRLDPAGMPEVAGALWRQVAAQATEDERVQADRRRREERRGGSWADSVAGRMSRRYSPGRTWQTLARAAVRLGSLGDVLDIGAGDGAMAELLAPRAASVVCVDRSARVVEMGAERTRDTANIEFRRGDMHDLPVTDGSCDLALLMNALCHSGRPALVLAEAARALRRGGRLVGATLARHDHLDQTARFDHLRPGFEPDELAALLTDAGLTPSLCAISSRERRAPNFEGITFDATKEGP